MLVIAVVLGYSRLLADTAKPPLLSLILLLAPTIAAAFLLIRDPRTWSTQLAFSALFLGYLPGMILARSYRDGSASQGLFVFLIFGAWFALLDGCAARLQLTGGKRLAEVAVLLILTFFLFCSGILTLR